ncbi:MAG: class I SAM-dependent methyltransferase [Hyphomonadaceae bacterium]
MRRPRFIAEQARHAKGPIGRLIAFIMARETWGQNMRAIEALGVTPDDQVLDIGTGPGRSIAELAARAPSGRIVGVDPSELMAEIAVRRNRELVKARRAEIMVASAASLPFADSSFDKALCVHVIYFWNDLDTAFREIARVMKPGGRVALLFRTSADENAVSAFPAEVYNFRALRDVVAPLEAAGFAVETREDVCDAGAPALLIAAKRRPHAG